MEKPYKEGNSCFLMYVSMRLCIQRRSIWLMPSLVTSITSNLAFCRKDSMLCVHNKLAVPFAWQSDRLLGRPYSEPLLDFLDEDYAALMLCSYLSPSCVLKLVRSICIPFLRYFLAFSSPLLRAIAHINNFDKAHLCMAVGPFPAICLCAPRGVSLCFAKIAG